MWIFVKSNVWNPGQSRKLVVRLRATRPKASLTARPFGRSEKINPVCFGLVVHILTPASPAEPHQKQYAQRCRQKCLLIQRALGKQTITQFISLHIVHDKTQQKCSSFKELRSKQTLSKLLLYFSLKYFLIPLLFCQLATWQSLSFSLCSQRFVWLLLQQHSSTRVQRWCPVLLQGVIKCCTKWSSWVGRVTYPDVA